MLPLNAFHQLLERSFLSLRTGVITLLFVTACQQAPNKPETLSDFSSLAQRDRTTVVVLGMAHTAGYSGIDHDAFERVLEVLTQEKYDAIALERIPANEIEALSGNPDFKAVIEQFVGDLQDVARNAQRDTRLSSMEAMSILADWRRRSDAISSTERRDRALTALAAYDPESALLYWDSKDENYYPSYALQFLQTLNVSLNERVALGVVLARRMDHARVLPIDSHADKDLFFSVVSDLQIGMTDYSVGERVESLPHIQATRVLEREAIENNELIHLIEYLNRPETLKEDVKGQFDVFNRVKFPNRSGRVRLAAWDERNLRIAANIRRATAHHSGGRMLVVIGAGHKPFLDELLGVSLDLRVEQIDLSQR